MTLRLHPDVFHSFGSLPPPTQHTIVYAEQVHLAEETKTMTKLYVLIPDSSYMVSIMEKK